MRRLLLLLVVLASLGLAACGGSSEEVPAGEPEISWLEEMAEEGYYYGAEAAEKANELCEDNGGTSQIVISEELGLEVVVCEDGTVEGVE